MGRFARRGAVGNPPAVPPSSRSLFRRAATTLGLLTLVLLLSGCGGGLPQNTFDAEGPIARTIQNLVNPVFITAGVVFVLVEFGTLFLALKYKRRKGDDEFPTQVHGNTRLEVGWTIVPALILALVGVATVATIFSLAKEPKDALKVTTYGQQWWWSYEYHLDGNMNGKPQIVTANDLVIPAGRKVFVNATSRDVIHSFWVPKLAGKADAVPGRPHTLTLEADHPGEYWGQCAEFCGLSHAWMRLRVIALSPGDWNRWLENQQKAAETPTDTEATKGLEIFKQQCAGCHLINGVNQSTYKRAAQVSGAAPNLTHLMTRDVIAGGTIDLKRKLPGCNDPVNVDVDKCLDRANLEAWLRNPPGMKPMAPTQKRGMPNLNLSEAQIDQLVAYLSTLD